MERLTNLTCNDPANMQHGSSQCRALMIQGSRSTRLAGSGSCGVGSFDADVKVSRSMPDFLLVRLGDPSLRCDAFWMLQQERFDCYRQGGSRFEVSHAMQHVQSDGNSPLSRERDAVLYRVSKKGHQHLLASKSLPKISETREGSWIRRRVGGEITRASSWDRLDDLPDALEIRHCMEAAPEALWSKATAVCVVVNNVGMMVTF